MHSARWRKTTKGVWELRRKSAAHDVIKTGRVRFVQCGTQLLHCTLRSEAPSPGSEMRGPRGEKPHEAIAPDYVGTRSYLCQRGARPCSNNARQGHPKLAQ